MTIVIYLKMIFIRTNCIQVFDLMNSVINFVFVYIY
jgi:hypothetical protein